MLPRRGSSSSGQTVDSSERRRLVDPLEDVGPGWPSPSRSAQRKQRRTLAAKALVAALFIALTAIATFEKVALKKAADSLTFYQVFLNQLIVLLFIIVFLAVVVYKRRVRTDAPHLHAALHRCT